MTLWVGSMDVGWGQACRFDNPLALDTDNDGICDPVDPEPNNPCVPNGIDSDGDGVCDVLDPDPTNPNPYIFPPDGPSGYTYSDGDGTPYNVEAYSSTGYMYDITSLEPIADRTAGTTEYDELNYVESMAFLYRTLKTSPYCRIVSPKLNAKFIQLNASSFSSYFEANDRLNKIHNVNRNMQLAIAKKKLYLNRLKNVNAKLNIKVTQDSLYKILVDTIYYAQLKQLNKLYNDADSVSNLKLAQLSAIVAGLPSDRNRHTALKNFYPTYISNVLNKQPLSAAQISSCLTMANSCHLVYGEAVHRSRELLIGAKLYNIDDFSVTCSPNPSLRTKANDADLSINVYPNPTTGEVFINKDQIDQIDVNDINGRLIRSYHSHDLIGGVLDLSIHDQSMCILMIKDITGKIHHHKIIIIR